MITFMYKKICVTNRHLVNGDYFEQIRHIMTCNNKADYLIVREKDLSPLEYEDILKGIISLDINRDCIIAHNFIDVARNLNVNKIHLPFNKFIENGGKKGNLRDFRAVGTSVHSLDDCMKAQELGVDYLIAGHIFTTDCKKGLEPRGVSFLQEICANSTVPVFAIGGIDFNNAKECINAGASGVCLMSAYMRLN